MQLQVLVRNEIVMQEFEFELWIMDPFKSSDTKTLNAILLILLDRVSVFSYLVVQCIDLPDVIAFCISN